jgi:uncharacterized protein YlxW (UPF0749 family)
MQDTIHAIAQLATVTSSDRGTVATLTTTNAKLATQLKAAQAQITQLKDEIAALKNKIKPAWQGQRPHKTTNNDSYCWSRCYQVAKSHTSATCNMKKADTRIQRPKATLWAESSGAKNDAEGS